MPSASGMPEPGAGVCVLGAVVLAPPAGVSASAERASLPSPPHARAPMPIPIPTRMMAPRIKAPLPRFFERAKIELEGPGGAILLGEVQGFGSDGFGAQALGVGRVGGCARVADGAVDDEQRHVDAFGRELACQRLGEAALRGLRGGEGGGLG